MIYCVPVRGVFETNCYFYVDGDSHAFLIDPGAQGGELLGLIRERRWMPEAILLTHGHFDHIGGIAAIREQLDIPPVTGCTISKEVHSGENSRKGCSLHCGEEASLFPCAYPYFSLSPISSSGRWFSARYS